MYHSRFISLTKEWLLLLRNHIDLVLFTPIIALFAPAAASSASSLQGRRVPGSLALSDVRSHCPGFGRSPSLPHRLRYQPISDTTMYTYLVFLVDFRGVCKFATMGFAYSIDNLLSNSLLNVFKVILFGVILNTFSLH